jgi:hypothetical protein
MAAKRKPKRADEPRLDDDSNWVTLTMAHHVLSEQLIGARGSALATMKLTEWLQTGELPYMRKNMVDPERRQPGRVAFWRGRRLYVDDDGTVGFYPPDQKRPRNHKSAYPGAILSGNRSSRSSCSPRKPSRRISGRWAASGDAR